jgi:adenosylcobinamide kinase/adenosylcobinamide-phosphate guanylyltransferase
MLADTQSLSVAHSELILGGQRSGKSRRAEALALAQSITRASRSDTLVVDCLTLWLTNHFLQSSKDSTENELVIPTDDAPTQSLLAALACAPGPVVLVGNEICMGVIPMGQGVRAFVDVLGRLNQDVARACQRVTLMVAGLPLTVKGQA